MSPITLKSYAISFALLQPYLDLTTGFLRVEVMACRQSLCQQICMALVDSAAIFLSGKPSDSQIISLQLEYHSAYILHFILRFALQSLKLACLRALSSIAKF